MTLAPTLPEQPLGRFVTFYSYKGGTGRSMALANVAWILASNGYRVLVVDWDLEAPGLHRYFKPYLRDKTLVATEGLIDFFVAFVDAARTKAPEGETAASGSATEPSEPWFSEHADLRMFASALDWGSFPGRGAIDFVSAGRQDAGYALRVNSFSWYHFYTKLGGGVFLEEVKRQLREVYDYVLIDSRTGVSDTSGICTVQMPDTLVVCFTLNEQSIDGACNAAVSATEQRTLPKGGSGLRVVPVPTRVDVSEKERVDLARTDARARFARFLDWIDEDQLNEYWGQVEVPYIPFYSLEEILAVFGDGPGHTNSVLAAMTAITAWLTEKVVQGFPPLDERLRLNEKVKFMRVSAAEQAQRRILPDPSGSYDVYLSYATLDWDDQLARFCQDLADELRVHMGRPTSIFASHKMNSGDLSHERVSEAVTKSGLIVCLLSPAYVRSAPLRDDLQHARLANKQFLAVEWVPVDRDVVPQPLDELLWFSVGTKIGVRAAGTLRSLADEYRATMLRLVVDMTRILRAAEAEAGPLSRGERLPEPEIQLVIMARRTDEPQALRNRNYKLRRRDWVPFPSSGSESAAELFRAPDDRTHVKVIHTPLESFLEWVQRPDRPEHQGAIVLVDPSYLGRSRAATIDRATQIRRVVLIACADPGDEEGVWLGNQFVNRPTDGNRAMTMLAKSPEEAREHIHTAFVRLLQELAIPNVFEPETLQVPR